MYEQNDDLSISDVNISSEITTSHLANDNSLLNLACTNARSIVEKVDALVTLFEENDLSLAIITETWLSQKKCSKRSLDDLVDGANISFIRKDRGTRGGGVAICYNGTKIKMSSFPVPNNGVGEMVCGIGSTSLTKRKVAVVAVYLPPSIKVSELESIMENLNDLLSRIQTKYEGAIIFVGGDFNKKDIGLFLAANPPP